MGQAGEVLGNIINVLVFLLKSWILVFVMMWVRWTLPRLRIDQVMMMCLKYLIPISCVLILGVSLWTLFMPIVVQKIISYLILALCTMGVVWGVMKVTTLTKSKPSSGMPGMWRMAESTGYQGAARPKQ